MTIVRADIEAMRHLGRQFAEFGNELGNRFGPQISSGVMQLETSWQGANRAQFDQQFTDWARYLENLAELSLQLGQSLNQAANELDEAANVYTGSGWTKL